QRDLLASHSIISNPVNGARGSAIPGRRQEVAWSALSGEVRADQQVEKRLGVGIPPAGIAPRMENDLLLVGDDEPGRRRVGQVAGLGGAGPLQELVEGPAKVLGPLLRVVDLPPARRLDEADRQAPVLLGLAPLTVCLATPAPAGASTKVTGIDE